MTPSQPPPISAEPDSPRSGVADGQRRAEADEPAMLFCPICSVRLASRKCKLFCQQCGYYMSCADYI